MEEPACAGRLTIIRSTIRPEFLIVILSHEKLVDDDEIKIGIIFLCSSFAFSPPLDWEGEAKLASVLYDYCQWKQHPSSS